MTTERPTFPPRRNNPYRLVGGIDAAPMPAQRRAEPEQIELSLRGIANYGKHGRET